MFSLFQAEQFLSGPEGNALSNDDKQAIRDAEKTVENRREWLQKNEAEIAAWLSSIKGSFYE